MKNWSTLFALFATVFALTSFVVPKGVDPTGTYTLRSVTEERDGDVYGYSGTIQVKQLDKHTVVMTFEINKGAPSYNMGMFVDTLELNGNKVLYTVPESDSSCRITFRFSKKGVKVVEETDNYNFGCGFGHAVVADGYYDKTDHEVPVLTWPGTGEPLNYGESGW